MTTPASARPATDSAEAAPDATLPRIPVFRPLLEREEIDAVVEAIEMGWLGMGSYVGAFEGGARGAWLDWA